MTSSLLALSTEVKLMKYLPLPLSLSLLTSHLVVFPLMKKSVLSIQKADHCVKVHMRIDTHARGSKWNGNPLVAVVTKQRMWGRRCQGFQSIVHCFLNARVNFHAPTMLLECCEFWSKLPHDEFSHAVNFEVNYLMMNFLMTTSYLSLVDWDLRSNEELTTPLVPIIAH